LFFWILPTHVASLSIARFKLLPFRSLYQSSARIYGPSYYFTFREVWILDSNLGLTLPLQLCGEIGRRLVARFPLLASKYFPSSPRSFLTQQFLSFFLVFSSTFLWFPLSILFILNYILLAPVLLSYCLQSDFPPGGVLESEEKRSTLQNSFHFLQQASFPPCSAQDFILISRER